MYFWKIPSPYPTVPGKETQDWGVHRGGSKSVREGLSQASCLCLGGITPASTRVITGCSAEPCLCPNHPFFLHKDANHVGVGAFLPLHVCLFIMYCSQMKNLLWHLGLGEEQDASVADACSGIGAITQLSLYPAHPALVWPPGPSTDVFLASLAHFWDLPSNLPSTSFVPSLEPRLPGSPGSGTVLLISVCPERNCVFFECTPVLLPDTPGDSNSPEDRARAWGCRETGGLMGFFLTFWLGAHEIGFWWIERHLLSPTALGGCRQRLPRWLWAQAAGRLFLFSPNRNFSSKESGSFWLWKSLV